MKNITLLIFIVMLFSGCIGTYNTLEEPKIYSATIYDIKSFANLEGAVVIFSPIVILDLPFSLVFDTILLPYKTYLIIAEDKNATKLIISK